MTDKSRKQREDTYRQGVKCVEDKDYSHAIKLFEMAINQGSVEALVDLGTLYFNGQGTKRDYHASFELNERAAYKGNRVAMRNLGIHYQYGYGVDIDLFQSVYYYRLSAENGFPEAQYDLGLAYLYGQGLPVNKKYGFYWIEKAADGGYVDALRSLGLMYENGWGVKNDQRKAFEYFQKGVERGNNACKENLAYYYENGIVVGRDENKARSLYYEFFVGLQDKASEGDVMSMFRIGDIYQHGKSIIHVPQDYYMAAKWYEKAASLGNASAQNALGALYYRGLGVAKNYEKAAYWYDESAKRGDVTGLYNLAGCYHLGRGIEKDVTKAALYYQQSANLGMSEAQVSLANMYYLGDGVERDYVLAARMYQEACKIGNSEAFYGLGCCYCLGHGVDKDIPKGFSLFEQGAKGSDIGSIQCQLAVAEYCMKGEDIMPNYVRAVQLIQGICGLIENNKRTLKVVTVVDNGCDTLFRYNPLDEGLHSLYAKSYYLLAKLTYEGKGVIGNPIEAIRLLRLADKYGYEDRDNPEETCQKHINLILREVSEFEVQDAVKSYVEVRETNRKIGIRYSVLIHHADDTETEIKFAQSRSKFMYVLGLLIAHEGRSVAGLTTRHFCYYRNDLIKLVEEMRIDTSDKGRWIDDFVYRELEANIVHRSDGMGSFSFDNSRYSNALSGVKRDVRKACISEDEYKTFVLQPTGSRNSIATIAADARQIVLPKRLVPYLDNLPVKDEIESFIPGRTKRMKVLRD